MLGSVRKNQKIGSFSSREGNSTSKIKSDFRLLGFLCINMQNKVKNEHVVRKNEEFYGIIFISYN